MDIISNFSVLSVQGGWTITRLLFSMTAVTDFIPFPVNPVSIMFFLWWFSATVTAGFFLCPTIQWYSHSLNCKFLLFSSCYLPHSLLHGVSSSCPLSCCGSKVPQTHFLRHGSMPLPALAFLFSCLNPTCCFLVVWFLVFSRDSYFQLLYWVYIKTWFLTLHLFSKTSDSSQKVLFVC